MDKLFNHQPQKAARQQLRNRPTQAEKMLWYYVRGSNLGGYKFRRQQGIGPYVVDFYCPKGMLAIELDGDSHYREGAAKRDKIKQEFIEAQGVYILRFTDNEVRENIDEALARILQRLHTTLAPEPPPAPPWKRRGEEGKDGVITLLW